MLNKLDSPVSQVYTVFAFRNSMRYIPVTQFRKSEKEEEQF